MKEDFLQMKNCPPIQVFYLKEDEPNKELPLDAMAHELGHHLNALDVNENSAGGGEHAHFCAPSIHDLGANCCPVGEKGETGETGMYEEELVIKKVLDSLADSQINIGSESARIFLAKEIAKDLRDAGMLPHCPF